MPSNKWTSFNAVFGQKNSSRDRNSNWRDYLLVIIQIVNYSRYSRFVKFTGRIILYFGVRIMEESKEGFTNLFVIILKKLLL